MPNFVAKLGLFPALLKFDQMVLMGELTILTFL